MIISNTERHPNNSKTDQLPILMSLPAFKARTITVVLYVYICVVSVLPPSAVDVVNQELVPNRPPQWQRGNKFELTDQRVFTQLFELVPARSIIFHLRQ